MAYRWLSNWLATGTCWVAMALRSAWMVAWLMVLLKTQTSGPNAATFAPGQIDEGSCGVTTPAAAPFGTAASQAPATSAPVASRARLDRLREARPRTMVFMAPSRRGRGQTRTGWRHT